MNPSQRTVLLGPSSAAQVLLLESEDPTLEIRLIVNAAGGAIEEGLALHDTLLSLQCPLRTVCIGQAVGVAALVLAAGTPGRREAMPHARIQLGRAPSGARDDAERVHLQHALAQLLAARTGQTVAQVEADLARERTFDAAEARDYGLIDEVVSVQRK